MAATTWSSAGNQITAPTTNTAFLERTLLHTAAPKLHHDRFGVLKDIPLNNTDQITMRKYYHFDEDETGLGEGYVYISDSSTFTLDETRSDADTNAKRNTLRHTDITAQVSEFGGLYEYTKRARILNFEDPKTVGTEKLGVQAGLVADAFFREKLIANTAASTELDLSSDGTGTASEVASAFLAASTELMDREVEPITRILRPSEKVSTQGVDESYFAIIDPYFYRWLYDNKDTLNFMPLIEYPTDDKVKGEKGATIHIRFIVATHAHRYADPGADLFTDANVYVRNGAGHSVMIFAADTYGMVTLRGRGRAKIVSKDPGDSGIYDPFDREGTVSWQTWLGFADLYPYGRQRINVTLDY